jgi:hypothetical protein
MISDWVVSNRTEKAARFFYFHSYGNGDDKDSDPLSTQKPTAISFVLITAVISLSMAPPPYSDR